MDSRILILVFVVSSFWCCSARDFTVLQPFSKLSGGKAQQVENNSRNELFCTLCEEYAGEALTYLSNNNTQTDIISILHQSCSKIIPFKQECNALVDQYVPVFFLEISSIQAEDLCRTVDLCEKEVLISKQPPKDKCELCHNAVTEALQKLKDPDTEMEIVAMLLKACNSAGKTVKKCKRLVFEYAPVILTNAEQFLETKNVCSILHACDSAAAGLELGSDTSMHAAS